MSPKRKKLAWATIEDGEMFYLPRRRRGEDWEENPVLWQPLDPQRWTYDLPRPWQPQIQDRTNNLLDLVPDPIVPIDPQWWRDATLIFYSEAGDVSLKEAEGRIMRMLCTEATLRGEGPGYSTGADVLAKLAQTAGEQDVTDPRHDWRPPFSPNNKDLDDYPVASRWFAGLHPVEMRHKGWRPGNVSRGQKVLRLRAMDPAPSWKYIGQIFSVTGERGRQIYQQTIERIWRLANGHQPYAHLTIRDQIADLRERNRAYAQGR